MSEDARALICAAQEVSHRTPRDTDFPTRNLPILSGGGGNAPASRSDRQRYHDAIEELEYEGAIEWDASARYARGDKHYLITQRGLNGSG